MNEDLGRLDPETLLAHAGFVRALARSLVWEEDAAADLEQDTWLAALRRPEPAPRSWRAWLAAVASNLARMRIRGARRREARERVASVPEALPSAAELLEREDARRKVVEMVLELDEPYRSTVVLRYLQELPPREVAARQGVPVETVRTRLKRALAQIRERLDARHGGERRTWVAALLPLTGAPPPVEFATATSSAAIATLAGGAVLSTGTKIGIAALLLVAAGLATIRVTTPAGTAPVAEEPGREKASASRETPDAERREHSLDVGAGREAGGAGAAESDRPTPPAAPAAAGRAVHGRVVDEERRPIPGARVARVFQQRSSAGEWSRIRRPAATSGADGRFTLPIGDDTTVVWFVEATAAGRARCETTVALPDEGPPADVEIPLGPGAEVEGTVSDPSGAPLAGAFVAAFQEERVEHGRLSWLPALQAASQAPALECRTDSRGSYRIEHLAARAPHSVLAVLAGKVGRFSPTFVPEPGERKRMDITLDAAGTVHGTVRGPDGEPVDQKHVTFSPTPCRLGDISFTAPTDPKGDYRHDGLPPGIAFEVKTSAGGARQLRVPCEPLLPHEVRRLDLNLVAEEPEKPTGPSVLVSVRDTSGRPITGKRILGAVHYNTGLPSPILVREPGEDGAHCWGAWPDERGEARIALRSPGPFEVSLSLLGLTETRAGVEPDGPVTEFVVDWGALVSRLAWVSVIVAEAGTDRRVAGASVRLLPETRDRTERILMQSQVPRTMTDGDGIARFPQKAPGLYVLRAAAPGRATWEGSVRVEPGGPREFRVPLEPGALISGRLQLQDGRGASGFGSGVVCLRRDGSLLDSEEAWVPAGLGPEGQFTLHSLPPGPLVLHAVASGHSPVNRHLVLAPGERRDVEIRLVPGHYVGLRVPGFAEDEDEVALRDPRGEIVLVGSDLSVMSGGPSDVLLACLAHGRYVAEVRRAEAIRLRGEFNVTAEDAANPSKARIVSLSD